MNVETSGRSERSRHPKRRSHVGGDVVLGIILALATATTASLLGIAAIVIVPALAVGALIVSWAWRNRILRTFAITMAALTLLAVAAYFLSYLPYMLAALLEAVF